MMRPPGFEGLAGAMIETWGQPIRIRLDMGADPVVTREVSAIVRTSTASARLYGRDQQPLGTRVFIDQLDCDGIEVDRCEIDVSVLQLDPAGAVRIGGERYTIAGWTTYVAAGGAEDGTGEDGLYRIFRLQRK